jgi:hypothetical protein
MGYFRRPIDRGQSRDRMRVLHERGEANRPWEALPSAPPTRPCFLRFASLEVHEDSRRRSGIFQTAFRVLDDPDVDAHLFEATRRSPSCGGPTRTSSDSLAHDAHAPHSLR